MFQPFVYVVATVLFFCMTTTYPLENGDKFTHNNINYTHISNPDLNNLTKLVNETAHGVRPGEHFSYHENKNITQKLIETVITANKTYSRTSGTGFKLCYRKIQFKTIYWYGRAITLPVYVNYCEEI